VGADFEGAQCQGADFKHAKIRPLTLCKQKIRPLTLCKQKSRLLTPCTRKYRPLTPCTRKSEFSLQELSSRIGKNTEFETLQLKGEIAENVIKNIENAKKYLNKFGLQRKSAP
jgi:uncharacterized protein YjbI with pentapeptide repeats